jgi:ribosomal-protein-alanine N-acetyltransferase
VIQLRGVEIADLDALFAIDRECFRPGIAYSRTVLRYYLKHPHSLSILAEDDLTKAIIGFAIAETRRETGFRVGHIITIDVRHPHRRRSVGRMLMAELLAQLRTAGATAVRLEVAADNSAAQAFYQSFGFDQTGRIPGYYMGSLDALSMEMRLDR